jgi:hypothetical protein
MTGRFHCAAVLAIALLVPHSLVRAEGESTPRAKAATEPLHKSSYRIIDIHCHAPFPSEAALRAHLDVLDRVGVTAFNVLLLDASGWSYPGGWSEPNLLAWLELRKRFPERVLVFGTVDFNRVAKVPTFFADIVTELEVGASRGMQGVKIWKNLGMHHKDAGGKLLRIDDPRLDLFWKTCGKLGMPVLIHTADPKEYWYPSTYNTFQFGGPSTGKYFKHPDVPAWEELIRQRNNVLKKHPKTKFIGAHFASLSSDFDELAKTLDEYPNLSVDCAARLRFMYRYNPVAVRAFFVKYQDRILFGTDDFLMADPKLLDDGEGLKRWQEKHATFYSRYLEYFETDHVGIIDPYGTYREWMRLTGIRLPPEVLEKLYHANAEKLIPGLKKR